MIGPQELAAAIAKLPGIAKAIETSGILVAVVIGAVLIFEIIKLVLKYRSRGNGKEMNNPNPGYVAQVQKHLSDSIIANKQIENTDARTDKLGECMVLLAANQAQGTRILEKISDGQIALTTTIALQKKE